MSWSGWPVYMAGRTYYFLWLECIIRMDYYTVGHVIQEGQIMFYGWPFDTYVLLIWMSC